MAIVLATYLWLPTATGPKLHAIDVDDDANLVIAHAYAPAAEREMHQYMDPKKGVPYHGHVCNGNHPMMLRRTVLTQAAENTALHKPLTASWGERWYCPSCGKTSGSPDLATTGHHQLKVITAFNATYDEDEFSHPVKETA